MTKKKIQEIVTLLSLLLESCISLSVIIQIYLKEKKNNDKNKGTFGCLGIVGLSADNANTVVDYIKFTPFITMIVELIFMSHLVAVLPILFYLSQK